MNKKRVIAIVAGGDSSENPVSLRSAATLLENIDKKRYEPYILEIEGKCWEVHLHDGSKAAVDRNDFGFTWNGQKTLFDYAYITIHGTPGENGVFEGYLRLMRIPFSTSDLQQIRTKQDHEKLQGERGKIHTLPKGRCD